MGLWRLLLQGPRAGGSRQALESRVHGPLELGPARNNRLGHRTYAAGYESKPFVLAAAGKKYITGKGRKDATFRFNAQISISPFLLKAATTINYLCLKVILALTFATKSHYKATYSVQQK